MKHFLLPITCLVWFLLVNYSIDFTIAGIIFLHSFSWLSLILLGIVFIGIIKWLFGVLPQLILIKICQFYSFSWLSTIAHTLFGLLGLIVSFYSVRQMKIPLSELWDDSWGKNFSFRY
jgi:hypothetical protein